MTTDTTPTKRQRKPARARRDIVARPAARRSIMDNSRLITYVNRLETYADACEREIARLTKLLDAAGVVDERPDLTPDEVRAAIAAARW